MNASKYENEMRGMMSVTTFSDAKLSKESELNETMSIDKSNSTDEYTKTLKNLK